MSEKQNIPRLTRRYVMEHPAILACLSDDLLNHSALARKICEAENISKFDAVLKAVKRYQLGLKVDTHYGRKIHRLLKKSRLEIKSKMMVATVERQRSSTLLETVHRVVHQEQGDFTLIEGQSAVTLITNSSYRSLMKNTFGHTLLRLKEDLVQVCMRLDPEISNTPGVVAHVYGLLAFNGINMHEEMSCWTDLMFMIDEQDLGEVTELLRF